jgi:2-(1,2-epoxy-1,2-dihydrophenyl)acetyl-CoA isomerase
MPLNVPLKTLLFEMRDNVAWITFNRPASMNAMNHDAMHDLHAIANFCATDNSVRAAVLTGAGDRAFCAGGDVSGFHANLDELPRRVHEGTTFLHAAASRFSWMRAPLIAAVNGVAAGAGLSAVAWCDLAIAADTATFTSAYTKIGFTPDGSSTWFLSRILGRRRAMELYLTNRVLTAHEALEWGLVNRVVPAADLMVEVTKLANQLANGPTRTFGGVKRLLHNAASDSLESQMELETRTLAEMAGTADAREGIRSFVEKRKPRFTGE